jgi:hypothetical protein
VWRPPRAPPPPARRCDAHAPAHKHRIMLITTAQLLCSAAAATTATTRTTPPPVNASQPTLPPFVGRWVGATQSLPDSKLPQNPLLGNGHLGVLLDSRVASLQGGHAAFVLHNDTRCGSKNSWPLIGHNLSLQQCEANCTGSPRCGAFSYCDAAAGATGCAVSAVGTTSRCFQFPDMSQCDHSASEVGWTSGLRQAGPLPSAPGVASNVTLDLWLGSNSMWAVNACPGPSKRPHNTNRSAPFNPHWAPPFAPSCARRIALGGLSFQLPARGRLVLTMEQHIGQPRLRAAVSSELGNFTLVAYLHPVENMLVVDIDTSNALVVNVSAWALNSSTSPSSAAVSGLVGTVTREAVDHAAIVQHNDTGLKNASRPKPDRQIVASLASASAAIDSWMKTSTPARFAEGRNFQARTVVASTVSLTPGEVVSVFTVVVDNSLSGLATSTTAAVTELATARAAAAIETGATAGVVRDAADAWWLEFWQQSSIRLPTRPAIEQFWCVTHPSAKLLLAKLALAYSANYWLAFSCRQVRCAVHHGLYGLHQSCRSPLGLVRPMGHIG